MKRFVCCVTGSEKSPPGAGNRADDADGSYGSFQGRHPSPAFIEFREPGREVGREAFLRRHFLEPAGKFAECLGPTRGRVRHDGDPETHVAVILGEGNAGVNRNLPRRNRHVGCVRYENGAFHDGPAGSRIDDFREFPKHVGHLISPFAAADIDDDVGIAPFRDRVLGHCLSGPEAAGDGRGSSLGNGEKEIDDALARKERFAHTELSREGPRRPDRPGMGKPDFGSSVGSRDDVGYRVFPLGREKT